MANQKEFTMQTVKTYCNKREKTIQV